MSEQRFGLKGRFGGSGSGSESASDDKTKPFQAVSKPSVTVSENDTLLRKDDKPVVKGDAVKDTVVKETVVKETKVTAPAAAGAAVGAAAAAPVARASSATTAATTSAATSTPAPRPAAAAATTTSTTGAAGTRRTRKARLRLARLDPWSVMKTSFLFSIAGGIMFWVATYVVWGVIGASGMFDAINSLVADLVEAPGDKGKFKIENYISTNKVLGFSAILAVVDIVIFTALATLGAFLYNLSATMLGGIELTLAED